MYSYIAYGLGIQSEIPIPEFISAEAGCDVTLTIDRDSSPSDYLSEKMLAQEWGLSLNRQQAVFYVKDAGVFLIQGGRKIVVVPIAEATQKQIRLYLVGTIMAILLYQREFLVLHASVANINGNAIAILGESGQGKSSTAAAFYRKGYYILTDDVAPVTLAKGPATITPGFPQIKLCQKTAEALGYDFDSLDVINSPKQKRGHRLKPISSAPLPIGRIYVLYDDEEFKIEPLTPKESVIELVRHSRPTTLYHSGDTNHFFQCVTLAKEYGVYRLGRPRNLTLLPEIVKLVEENLSSQLTKALA
ncbi:MAG: serine kinase [Rivularia sp. (in: Bacteria)]|nr:serine kinase [Rivularia sp. MS3]